MMLTTIQHGFRLAAIFALAAACLPAQLGMISDDGSERVTVFNASSDTVIGSVAIPGAGLASPGDCVITRDQRLGFVTTFRSLVYVVDLTTVPPTLASGINPIRISNPGEDIAISADGKYLVICDGGNVAPISVVDIATRREISTFSTGRDCNSVSVCDNGEILASSWLDGRTRRLKIDSSGTITATLNSIATGGVNNVECTPGSRMGVAVLFGGTVMSFRRSNMTLRQTRALSSRGLDAVFSRRGTRVFIRGITSLDAFDFDPTTGAFSAAAVWSTALPPQPRALGFFGMDVVAVHPDDNKVYASAGAVVNVYNPAGTLLTTITTPGMTATSAVCIADCPTTPRTLRVPQQYATIQDALCLACPGDTIILKNGVHDCFDVKIKDLCIIGRNYPRVNGPIRVKADGVKIQGLHVYVTKDTYGIIVGAENATIKSNVVFGENRRTVTGGIWVFAKGCSILDNVVIDCNFAGIVIEGRVDVSGCQIRRNRCNSNGEIGIYCAPGSAGATIRGNFLIDGKFPVAGDTSGHDVKNNKIIPF